MKKNEPRKPSNIICVPPDQAKKIREMLTQRPRLKFSNLVHEMIDAGLAVHEKTVKN
jgi:hypothetical protein